MVLLRHACVAMPQLFRDDPHRHAPHCQPRGIEMCRNWRNETAGVIFAATHAALIGLNWSASVQGARTVSADAFRVTCQ